MDDLPQPEGPEMSPTRNVVSASVDSIRVFQKRRLAGSPSRSRGPGSSSRKKSASWASKEPKPFGTILMGWWSQVGVVGEVPDRLDAIAVDGSCVTAGEPLPFVFEGGWLTV